MHEAFTIALLMHLTTIAATRVFTMCTTLKIGQHPPQYNTSRQKSIQNQHFLERKASLNIYLLKVRISIKVREMVITGCNGNDQKVFYGLGFLFMDLCFLSTRMRSARFCCAVIFKLS